MFPSFYGDRSDRVYERSFSVHTVMFCMTSLLRPWNTLGDGNLMFHCHFGTRQSSFASFQDSLSDANAESNAQVKKENPGKHAWRQAKLGSSWTQYPTAHTDIQWDSDDASDRFFVRLELLELLRSWKSSLTIEKPSNVPLRLSWAVLWLDLLTSQDQYVAAWEVSPGSSHQQYRSFLAWLDLPCFSHTFCWG